MIPDELLRHGLAEAGVIKVQRLATPNTRLVGSEYVETFWLPVIGPSALWILRRLDTCLQRCPDGYDVPLPALAGAMGLRAAASINSPVVRSLARLAQFGVVTIEGAVVRVPPALAPISHRQAARLPAHLAALHAAA